MLIKSDEAIMYYFVFINLTMLAKMLEQKVKECALICQILCAFLSGDGGI